MSWFILDLQKQCIDTGLQPFYSVYEIDFQNKKFLNSSQLAELWRIKLKCRGPYLSYFGLSYGQQFALLFSCMFSFLGRARSCRLWRLPGWNPEFTTH